MSLTPQQRIPLDSEFVSSTFEEIIIVAQAGHHIVGCRRTFHNLAIFWFVEFFFFLNNVYAWDYLNPIFPCGLTCSTCLFPGLRMQIIWKIKVSYSDVSEWHVGLVVYSSAYTLWFGTMAVGRSKSLKKPVPLNFFRWQIGTRVLNM